LSKEETQQLISM